MYIYHIVTFFRFPVYSWLFKDVVVYLTLTDPLRIHKIDGVRV